MYRLSNNQDPAPQSIEALTRLRKKHLYMKEASLLELRQSEISLRDRFSVQQLKNDVVEMVTKNARKMLLTKAVDILQNLVFSKKKKKV